MLNKIFKTAILILSLLLFSIINTSCEKSKSTIGIVIVKDANNQTVEGATVVLHNDGLISTQGSTPVPKLRKEAKTDENGIAEFLYELEAILKVDVEKITGNETWKGSNVIRLLKEKTVTQVIEIN